MPEPHKKGGPLLPVVSTVGRAKKSLALRRAGSHGRAGGAHHHAGAPPSRHPRPSADEDNGDDALDAEDESYRGDDPSSPSASSSTASSRFKRGASARPGPSSPGTSPSKSKRPPARPKGWTVLWALFIASFLVCVACLGRLGYLVQQQSGLSNGDVVGGARGGLFSAWRSSQVLSRLQSLSSSLFSSARAASRAARSQRARQALADLGEYECVGWRQTLNCTPEGAREFSTDRNCSAPVPNGVSGYCEVRHRSTGETQRVLEMHCDSLRPGVQFQCDMFQSLLSYSILSTDYTHDPNASFARNREDLRRANGLAATPAPVGEDGFRNESVGQLELSFERGIVLVIYEKLLLGAYVSVRSLRAMGCALPVEMWYKASETDVAHPLLRLLVDEYGVFLREIRDARATHFYTKLHAIFYSAFDQVLLLDADNFAVRDPNYLFDTKEFQDTGALFWPDFWKPGNTIFNIHERSFVWTLFGLDYVDMFEQESGQVLIDRARHQPALNTLMYYGFSHEPRVHEELRVVWGDKDLFRFAWMKHEAPFYMAARPPGSAGTKHPDYDLFCGVTMVQHDPSGRVVFLHRNTEKLTHLNDRLLWTHIQQFKRSADERDYYVRGANGGKVFPQFKRCFGKDVHYEKLFTLKPMSAFPFEHLEADLLRYAKDGAAFLQLATGDDKAADDQV